MRQFIVEADGGSRGNPGPAGYGAVVIDAATGETLAEAAEFLGVATNNVAEYRGLVAGLRAARELDPAASVRVRMDSKLVVEQMSGRWRIKHPDMKPLAAEAARVLPAAQVTYEWIPRERNKHADRLANEAMDAGGRGEQWSAARSTADRAARAARTAPPEPAGPPGDAAAGAARARAALARPPATATDPTRTTAALFRHPASSPVVAASTPPPAGSDTQDTRDAPDTQGTPDTPGTRGEGGAADTADPRPVPGLRAAADARAARNAARTPSTSPAPRAPGTSPTPAGPGTPDGCTTPKASPASASTGPSASPASTGPSASPPSAEPGAALGRTGPVASPEPAEDTTAPAPPVQGAPIAPVAPTAPPDLGPPATFVLLRHGETPLTPQKRFSGSGGSDPALSEVGRQQARRVAAALAARGTIEAIVSSPLARCRETAGIVAGRLGLDVVVEDGLRETDFGAWEGLTFGEVRERHPEDLNAWLHSTEAEPTGGGESFAAVERRVAATRDGLVAAYAGRSVLLVSHVTPVKTLVRLALGAPPQALFRMELSAASLSALAYYADGNASLRLLNDTSHLR
ncbi:histidine phosphatase family protein [Streptomyces sp. NPDC005907]|uniref:histidine phosphatase family protein n=1 Tax=Streptomyces sp. NPDC005907 TaxID=3154571 RepID=UPI00340339DF